MTVPAPTVVLVTANWSGPAKPAPTILRELSRRWGPTVHAVLLENPDDAILDLFEVAVIPTWLRFERSGGPASSETTALTVEELRGSSLTGEDIVLPGPWSLTHRRSGALPKHVIADEFGPDSFSVSADES